MRRVIVWPNVPVQARRRVSDDVAWNRGLGANLPWQNQIDFIVGLGIVELPSVLKKSDGSFVSIFDN
jgi:hypothetical protein